MLNNRLLVLFMVLGVIFWFSGLMMVRLGGAAIFSEGNPLLVVVYIAAFPLLWVAVRIGSLIGRVPMNEMLVPVVVMTFTAVFIDGFVIAWFPHLYGDEPVIVMRGAGWILWGGGAGLLVAWILSLRRK